MSKGPILAGVILLALGIFVCHQAAQLSLGKASRPGPGFVPFGLGFTLILLSLLYMIHFLRTQAQRGEPQVYRGLPRTFLAIGILCLCIGLLSWLGYLISTFLLFLMWLAIIERRKWYLSLGLSFLALVVVYYFNLLFLIQLPEGLIKGF
jgi:putative tricarboxylic transport membrane protein